MNTERSSLMRRARSVVPAVVALSLPVLIALLLSGAPLAQPGLWLAALAFALVLAYHFGLGGGLAGTLLGLAFLAVVELVSRSAGRAAAPPSFLPWAVAGYLLAGVGISWIAELLHRRLLVVLENMSEAALVLTPAGVVRKAGGAVQQALGQKPADVEGTRFERFLDGGSREQLREILRGKHEGRSLELRTEGVKRGARLLRLTVHDRRQVRRFRGYLLRVRDVTSERRAEEQARRVSRMQAIAALSAALGHDLNNALTTIQGNADLLAEDLAGNSSAQAQLAAIASAAERSARRVEMLLAFTRQQVLRPRPLQLASVLEGTRASLEELLGPGIRVDMQVENDLPDISFDPVQLRRILFVLAARARNAIGDGGEFALLGSPGEITPEEAATYAYPVTPGDYALLQVRDTGAALSASATATIFEPFTHSYAADATGLELGSVYGTIKQAGGFVWVDSGSQGTVFRIYLPFAVDPLPLLAESPAAAPRPARRILVVEDDHAVRAVVRETLLRRGYAVLEADGAAEALQVVETAGGPPDALITDLVMPGVGGMELAQVLLHRYGLFPVLFISGYAHDDVASLLKPSDRLLCKPFSPVQLTEALQNLLEGGPDRMV